MADEPQHWPSERMILEGHSEYATFEDLEGLTDSTLEEIASLCESPEFQPDECVPCRAHTTLLAHVAERTQEKLHEGRPSEDVDVADLRLSGDPALQAMMEGNDALPEVPERPIADRFHDKVQELALLTEQMLAGPPIPPPGVSLGELATLVVGAKRWLAMIDAQGLTLSDDQEQIRAETSRIVSRLQQGS